MERTQFSVLPSYFPHILEEAYYCYIWLYINPFRPVKNASFTVLTNKGIHGKKVVILGLQAPRNVYAANYFGMRKR